MHNACSYKSLGRRLRLSVCILKSRFNIWVGVASANVHVCTERLNTRENCNVSASKPPMHNVMVSGQSGSNYAQSPSQISGTGTWDYVYSPSQISGSGIWDYIIAD